MKTRRLVATACTAAVAVALAAACSKSSTGPSDPLVGTWQVSWHNLSPNFTLTPGTFTLSVAKSGTSYKGTYPNITWSYTSPSVWIDTFSDTATASTFAIRNDTLLLHAQDPIAPACSMDMVGVISGTSITFGTVAAGGVMCVPASWTFSATKQ